MEVVTADSGSLRAWLQFLYDANGYLTPGMVKSAASDPQSPGHSFVYHLPPKEAAEAYYLQRAHELIRVVRIRATAEDHEVRSVRLYHAVPTEQGQFQYLALPDLIGNVDQVESLRREVVRRLRQAEQALTELEAVVEGRWALPVAQARRGVRDAKRRLQDEA